MRRFNKWDPTDYALSLISVFVYETLKKKPIYSVFFSNISINIEILEINFSKIVPTKKYERFCNKSKNT